MTRCSWAACDKPAAVTVDTWPMCPAHLTEHHALVAEQERDNILDLLRQGWDVRTVANVLGVQAHRVRMARRTLAAEDRSQRRAAS